MEDISALIYGRDADRFQPPATAVEATVAEYVDAATGLFVTIPSFDDGQRFGPCRFVGPAPGRGDPCLAVFDEEREPWVILPGVVMGEADRWVENVREYGAVGDGVHDDGPAIQATIDAATVSGKRTWFPLGRYITRQQILVRDGTFLMGNGPSSVVALAAHLPANLDLISVADRTAGASNVTVANLTLDGDKANQNPALNTTILQLWNVKNLLLQDLIVRNGLIEGVYVYNSDAPRIVNVSAIGNGFPRADASGFHLESCRRAIVNGCVSDTNGFHGFILTGTTDSAFTNCRAASNGFDGARVQYNSDRNRFTNFLSDTNFRGIYFTTQSTLNHITDATLINAEASGLVFNNSANNIATRCHVENCNYAVETVVATDINQGFGNTWRANRAGIYNLVAGSAFNVVAGAGNPV